MKVQSKTIPPIHLATVDDETRRPLMDIWLEDDRTAACPAIKDSACVIATDGRIAAYVPVEVEDGDVGGRIPAAGWEGWVKSKLPACAANGTVMGYERAEDNAPNMGAWPWVGMRQIKAEAGRADADEMQVEVGIDADLLLRLAKAMGVWGPSKKGRMHKAQKVAPVVLTVAIQRPRDKDVLVKPRAVTKPIAVRPAVYANSVHRIGADLRARGVIMPMVNS